MSRGVMAHECLTRTSETMCGICRAKLMDLPVLLTLNPLPYQANR